jgi:hypothetical protein
LIVAVSVGALPQARLIVANQAVIVLTVPHCNIDTINGCASVHQVIVKVIAVQEALPLTTCTLFTEQSNATVCAQLDGVYVLPTSVFQACITFHVIVHQDNGNAHACWFHWFHWLP